MLAGPSRSGIGSSWPSLSWLVGFVIAASAAGDFCKLASGQEQPSAEPATAADLDQPRDTPSAAGESSSEPAAAEPKAPANPPPVSFMRDVAPILVRSCIACHNPKKSESKYVMTTFQQLAKGGKQGEGITLVPGSPDDCYLIDVLLPDAEPRMPYKQDPLQDDELELLTRWVAEGAKYDGNDPAEDWTFLLRKTQHVAAPEVYPTTIPITALEFTPDGREILASGFHELTGWTIEGSLRRRVPGLLERIYDIAYSSDGTRLAVAAGDPGQYGLVRVWMVDGDGELKPERDLAESQDAVFAVAFSPDGSRLATAGADRTIRVYETTSGKLLAQIEDHADWVLDLAFNSDGTRLATASRDKTSKVFDVEQRESLVTFTGHAQPVFAVAVLPDGKRVATAGEDARVRIWNADGEAKQVRELGGFEGPVFALKLSPDGQTLAAASADHRVRLFDPSDGKLIRTLEGHRDWIYALAITRDGGTLASGSWDGQVRLWNLSDGKNLTSILAAPGYHPGEPQAAR